NPATQTVENQAVTKKFVTAFLLYLHTICTQLVNIS
ncbi:hypothetical protein EZS27_043935, partial [termite gut metagenome]